MQESPPPGEVRLHGRRLGNQALEAAKSKPQRMTTLALISPEYAVS